MSGAWQKVQGQGVSRGVARGFQTRPEHRAPMIGARFRGIHDAVDLHGRAVPEVAKVRTHEPHPVGPRPPCPQLFRNYWPDPGLCFDKPFEFLTSDSGEIPS